MPLTGYKRARNDDNDADSSAAACKWPRIDDDDVTFARLLATFETGDELSVETELLPPPSSWSLPSSDVWDGDADVDMMFMGGGGGEGERTDDVVDELLPLHVDLAESSSDSVTPSPSPLPLLEPCIAEDPLWLELECGIPSSSAVADGGSCVEQPPQQQEQQEPQQTGSVLLPPNSCLALVAVASLWSTNGTLTSRQVGAHVRCVLEANAKATSVDWLPERFVQLLNKTLQLLSIFGVIETAVDPMLRIPKEKRGVWRPAPQYRYNNAATVETVPTLLERLSATAGRTALLRVLNTVVQQDELQRSAGSVSQHTIIWLNRDDVIAAVNSSGRVRRVRRTEENAKEYGLILDAATDGVDGTRYCCFDAAWTTTRARDMMLQFAANFGMLSSSGGGGDCDGHYSVTVVDKDAAYE